MTTLRLYELSEQYQTLLEIVGDGEVAVEDYEKALADLRDEIEDKVASIGKVWVTLGANCVAIKVEEERLGQRRKALEGRQTWLKEYLLRELTTANIKRVNRPAITVRLQANPPSVEVKDEDTVPVEFKKRIEYWQVEKKPIIDHWKATGEVPGGIEVTTDKQSVVIR